MRASPIGLAPVAAVAAVAIAAFALVALPVFSGPAASAPAPGAAPDAAAAAGAAGDGPGWTSLLPPVLAIGLALLFRNVVPALLAGVWIGACLVHGWGAGTLRTIDTYALEALTDADHMSIVLFSILLGGMVGIVSRSGGTRGLVAAFAPYATTGIRGQFVTWLLGLAIFFDDYANTLLVGSTMRPVTDRLRISREKLAYLVDSTAAPVASIFLVSTWIGYEVSLIGEALKTLEPDSDPYTVFLQSLPFNFYPILALVFCLFVARSGRDFGPMLAAERRAHAGKPTADGAVPLSDFEGQALAAIENRPHRWYNAVVPVIVVLVVTFAAIWITGRASLAVDGDPLAERGLFALGIQGLGKVMGAGNSYAALLYGSLAGCVVGIALAVGQRILSLGQAIDAWLNGMKSMLPAFVILTLAWAISAVCKDLQTAEFMVEALSGRLSPHVVPTLVFLLAAGTAFATGSSWSTMGILIPLAVPTAYGLAQQSSIDPGHAHQVLLIAVSAVLAGAIFGDHCSPISDTTVMSSMSSGCDHVDHVRTQLPYALAVAGVAVVFGYLPAGWDVSPWISLVLSVAALWGLLRWFGRRADEAT